MKSITFTTGEFKLEKTSAWLVAFTKIAGKLDVFNMLDQVKVKMKEVNYTVRQKMVTIVLSIAAGCEYTSDINHKLVPDTVVAEMVGMPRFPDQSQINELLRRSTVQNVEQLKNIHHALFMQNAKCLSTIENVVVDMDMSGLIANGKKYESVDKGYFSKKKNQKGYQLSAAFCGGENSETISVYLDPGNTHCSFRFDELLKDTLIKLCDVAKNNRLILRLDSGYGSDDNIEKMRYKVRFVVKAYSTVRATNIGKTIKKEDWDEIDGCVDIFELPQKENLRFIVVRTLTKKGDFEYTMLVSNIPLPNLSAKDLFYFYNKRQAIEAFFKTCKNIYHIKNLRTKAFNGIYAFLWFVFITHNLISWMKSTVFHESKFEGIGTKTLIDKLGSIAAEVRRTTKSIEIILPEISAIARRFVECMRPRYEQLTLFSTS
jgi:hypothetical protein